MLLIFSILILILESNSTEEILTFKVSPINPIGKAYGRIHFKFKDIPTDYELVKIQGDFHGLEGIPIYRDINRNIYMINPHEGHVLYADINEAIFYNLTPDFNDVKILFIFYSKASKTVFSYETKLRIFPEIEEFKFTKDMSHNRYPFLTVPRVNPSKNYIIKLRNYDNDKTPINYIAVMKNRYKHATPYLLEKFDGTKKFNGLKLKYNKEKHYLFVSNTPNFGSLLNVQIMLIRSYKDVFQVYTTGLISLQNFYENFSLNHRTISWSIKSEYQNKINFDLYFFEGTLIKDWAKFATCNKDAQTCTIENDANNIFESATFTSITLKDCPPVAKFLLSFYVQFDENNVSGNTIEEEVDLKDLATDCTTQKEDFPNTSTDSADSDSSYQEIRVVKSNIRKGVPVRENLPSIRGVDFCFKEHEDPMTYSNVDQNVINDGSYDITVGIPREEPAQIEDINIYDSNDKSYSDVAPEDMTPVNTDLAPETNSQKTPLLPPAKADEELTPENPVPKEVTRHTNLFDPESRRKATCIGDLVVKTGELFDPLTLV